MHHDIKFISEHLSTSERDIKNDFEQALIYLGDRRDRNDKSLRRSLLTTVGWIIYLNIYHYFEEIKKGKKPRDYYKKIMGKNNTVITTNYDCLIEREFPEKSGERSGTRLIESKYFGFPRINEANETLNGPLILKIHGGHAYKKKGLILDKSLSLEQLLKNKDLIFVYTNNNKKFIAYKHLKSGEYGNDLSFKDNGKEYEQIIVPPIRKDRIYEEFELYVERTSDIMDGEIKNARRLFIIGYSFPDGDEKIRNRFINNMKTSEVYIIGPKSLDTTEKYLKIFTNGCKYIQMSAGDFVSYYPNNLEKCFEKSIEIKCPNH